MPSIRTANSTVLKPVLKVIKLYRVVVIRAVAVK
jgi:hypothetical protein